MTRQITVALLFLLTAVSTQAQKEFYNGFIVRETGDTLRGKINYRETDYNPKRIFFRNEKDTLTLGVHDLKGFMIARADADTVLYRKAAVTFAPQRIRLYDLVNADSMLVRDTVFLEVMIDGNLKLYSLKTFNFRSHYYIQAYDSAIEELVFRKYYTPREFSPALNARTYIVVTGNDDDPIGIVMKYKFQLLRAMRDCFGANEMIYKMRYKENELRDVFIKYNTCQGKNTIQYMRKPEKLKFHISIFGGFTSVWTPYSTKEENNKPKAIRGNGYAAGLGFNMGLTRDMPKLWLHTELGINGFHLKGTTPRLYSNFNFYTKTLSIHLLYLKLRVLPTYYFAKSYSKIAPYINGGFVCGYMVKELENKAYTGNNTDTNDPAIPNVKKYDLGFAASLGFRIYKYAGIEARYELGNGFSYNSGYGTITHSVMVTGRINIGEKPQNKPL